jgi:hypothetical protein
MISVDSNRIPTVQQRKQQQIIFSLDICTACMHKMSQDIIANNKKIQSDKRKTFVGTLDDLNGEVLAGTYNYYHTQIASVDIKISGQPNLCVDCNTPTRTKDKPCSKCGGFNFIVPANTSMDSDYLEINLSEKSYSSLQEKAKEVRNKAGGEWSTKS